ncbi:MAG: non-homologous end-joining DNA ligase [Alicyclobacillus sp.]|nr:non-homologous end-joining DNA ligase [Alicyclobacillus sp.]
MCAGRSAGTLVQAEHPVRITHPEKLLWPEAGITKADYIRYMAEMAPLLLHHVRDRPLTLVRFPDGVNGPSFYQKDAPTGTPEWVRTVPVWSTERGDHIRYVLADSVATLIWLANLACLELHVGFSTLDRPHTPTAVAFDLDPTVPGFEPVREVGLALHSLLQRLGLPHVAKTSGATGLQVFVPLTPGHTFAQTRVFTKSVAEYLLAKIPRWVTLERLKKRREDKVYVDYLQHGEGRTLVAAYSTRATRRATVSAPVTWGELERGAVPEQFTLRTMPARVKQTGDLLQSAEACDLRPIVSFLERRGAGL